MAKAKTAADDELEAARKVLEAARKHWTTIWADQKPRKQRALDERFCDKLGKAIEAADEHVTAAPIVVDEIRHATTAEEESRKKVYDELLDIRDEIYEAYKKDPKIQKAFLKGVQISPGNTTALVRQAGRVAKAFKLTKWNKKVTDAGITAKRIQALQKNADELKAADQAQGTAKGESKDATRARVKALAAMRKLVAAVKAVAKRLARKHADLKESFFPEKRRPKARPDKPVEAKPGG